MLAPQLLAWMAAVSSCAAATASPSGPVHLPLRTIRSQRTKPSRWPSTPNKRRRPSADDVSMTGDRWDFRYYVPVDVGTPAQTVTVVVDTGSDWLWMYGTDCPASECGDNVRFHPSLSSSLVETNQTFTSQYGGGTSQKGQWARDTVSIGNWSVDQFAFGVIEDKEDKNFSTDGLSSGMLGLGWFMEGSPMGWAHRLASNGQWNAPEFGVYLGRNDNWGMEVQDNSQLTLGGIDKSMIDGSVHYIPTVPSTTRNKTDPGSYVNGTMMPSGWYIPLEGAQMGSKVFNTTSQIALVDTGVYGIIMPNDIWHEYFSSIPGAVMNSNGFQYTFPCNSTSEIDLTITVGGMKIPIYRGDLVYAVGDVCWTTLTGSDILAYDYMKQNTWYLGDAFLKNVYTAFRYNPPSVGFGVLKPAFNVQTGEIHKASAGSATTTTGKDATATETAAPTISDAVIQPFTDLPNVGPDVSPNTTGNAPAHAMADSSASRLGVRFAITACGMLASLLPLF